MSLYKNVLLVFLLALSACKTSTLSFERSQLNEKFLGNSFSELYGSMEKFRADTFEMDTVKYEAKFEQRLVNIDNIGQFKLTNSLSTQKGVIPAIGNAHIIYLNFYVNGGVEKVLFVSSYYNEKKECVSLGPAYTGLVSRDNIQLLKKYNIKKKDNQFYLSENNIQDVDIRFYAAEKFRDSNGKFRNNILFNRIVTIKNMHPVEYLIFDIPAVFQDTSALKFSIQQ